MMHGYEKELEIAKTAAQEAGNYLIKREEMHVDAAEGKDIKLSSDKYSEKIIIDRLKETGIPILSEECGRVDGQEIQQERVLSGSLIRWTGRRITGRDYKSLHVCL